MCLLLWQKCSQFLSTRQVRVLNDSTSYNGHDWLVALQSNCTLYSVHSHLITYNIFYLVFAQKTQLLRILVAYSMFYWLNSKVKLIKLGVYLEF